MGSMFGINHPSLGGSPPPLFDTNMFKTCGTNKAYASNPTLRQAPGLSAKNAPSHVRRQINLIYIKEVLSCHTTFMQLSTMTHY